MGPSSIIGKQTNTIAMELNHAQLKQCSYPYTFTTKLWWFSFLLQVVLGVCYKNHFWPTSLSKIIWGFNICISFFLIPILVLIYCYGVIAWVLTRRMDSKLSSSSSSDTFHVARTNTIRTFLTVALCFIICWSSNQIYYLMYNIGYEIDWNSTFIYLRFLWCFLIAQLILLFIWLSTGIFR